MYDGVAQHGQKDLIHHLEFSQEEHQFYALMLQVISQIVALGLTNLFNVFQCGTLRIYGAWE